LYILNRMYHITDYTLDKAKRIGLEVRPSTKKNKKIDVYYQGLYVDSVGQVGYKDFPTYLKEDGLEVALHHQKLYKIRHRKGILQGQVGEILADYLLW